MRTKRILSGIRTTGPLHLGHYFGALRNWVELQNSDEYECFFLLADIQALTTHFDRVAEMQTSMREVALDFLAVGLDPEKSHFVLQSQVSELAELTMYFSMFTTLKSLQNNPTIKDELKKQKEVYYGFVGYPVSQAADILLFTTTPPRLGEKLLVPVGQDQVPHLESTRCTAQKFNSLYGETFVIPDTLIGEIPRLPGLDMQKMGKSADNAIFLKDDPDSIRKKVMSAFTDPKKIRVDNPGHPDGCAIFQYYTALAPELMQDVETKCIAGELGCVADKKRLSEILIDFLNPIRERRQHFGKNPDIVNQAIRKGTERAREIAAITMKAVRSAMNIDYLDIFKT